ncbi:hypothetical protein KC332_g665 [Hortaea werneckii]|nr:hypothetical protein KC350_g414 [Hortaea werneckii]KAI7276837.1 hypothetical protein KC335_g338 [Hortaea werneckii]KAI7420769.1 hypothetical protein KC332_g665 [Hortaea werneckii]KAI7456418.1 hypothetical protein KC368_g155 [Hortaea werneckii]KAI7502226.1 hypothetical protein KC364_g1022 [Hortaea werneckii]
MDRDILDRVAAEETAETRVTPEEGPRRSRSAQYLLNASAQLLDAALKKEEAYNRVPVTSALKIATHVSGIRKAQIELLEEACLETTTAAKKLELVRRAELLKVLAGVLEASPSISTQIVASHRIEQMKKVDEQVLINNIKEYSAERAKVAEAQQRGFDPSHLENLRKGDGQFQEDAHATQGLEQGATRFFQQAQDPTATSNPDDDFEGAIQWFFGKFRYEAKAEESLFLDMQSHDVEAYIIRRLRAQPSKEPTATMRAATTGGGGRNRFGMQPTGIMGGVELLEATWQYVVSRSPRFDYAVWQVWRNLPNHPEILSLNLPPDPLEIPSNPGGVLGMVRREEAVLPYGGGSDPMEIDEFPLFSGL